MAVITISRQYGSYGDAMAESVCDKLGYRSLDRGLLRSLAAELGITPGKTIGLSEERYRPQTLMERFFAHAGPRTRHPELWADYGKWIADGQLAAEAAIRLIYAAYDQGNVVIIGRGGQVVLSGKPDVLHVRLVAPLELRVRRHQVRAGLTAEAAREEVLAADRASAEFIQRYFDADVTDPILYNLSLNIGKLPLATAADVIIAALSALPARA